jgi:hypothetical protein
MKNDEIIEMARQAEFVNLDLCSSELERFAKLVAQHERDRMCEQCKWRNHENTTHNETN